MDFMLSRATRVTAQWASAPVQHAVARFWRDMEMTLSTTGFVPDNRLMICLAPALPPESYTLDVTENQLTLCAADDLGAVYGLLDISRHYLGVAPFWFWNQQQFEPKPFATVPEGRITGPAAAVGLRGWDLSVCLRARAESAVQAGSPPQPVGEAFLTRSTRLFASAWLCGKTQGPIQELAALLPAESYAEQLAAYQQLCTSALENYETLLPGCSYAGRATTPLWQEQVVFSVRLYLYALRGAVRFCTAREQFLDKDWQNCFCTLGRAADDFGAMAALLQPKTGFWVGFCSDTMLDGALTARVLTGLMAIPRAAGDGPDYAAWQAPLPGAPAAPVPDFTLYRALVQAETKKV